MVWLVGLVVFGAVATAWLTGHLFGRVVMFLLLGGVACGLALIVIPAYQPAYFLIGVPAAFVIASIPTWVVRHKARGADATFVVPYPR